MTQIYGIVAHPVAHSLSPIIHNAAFEALNIDAKYEKFDFESEDLFEFLKKVKKENILGLSVSIPHKETIIQYLDEVSDTAKIIGAVNTVINRNGKLYGTNTDYIGVLHALCPNSALNSQLSVLKSSVLILGAGGSARAIVYGLKLKGLKVFIANRTEEKAKDLAEEFDVNFLCNADLDKLIPDIIINTTSVGMFGVAVEKSPYPKELFKKHQIVMDIVYRPLMTKFLTDAKNAGCQIITGEKMLLYQAVEQFELWTNQKAPFEIMKKALIVNL